ncbi:MAG: hypothetical protein ACRDH2_00465 [Anaerolineales bacterium]
MNAASLSLDDLAQRCAEETRKYNRQQPSDTQYCFELLRRALADGLTEAFTRVYQIYERQVLRWVYTHQRFAQTDESADYFANLALSNFYFALRGPKFARFASLPQLLTYLKNCVHTAIAQYLRDQHKLTLASLDDAGEVAETPNPALGAEAADLWAHICRLLPAARDQLLARSALVLHLKPNQIASAHPAEWRNAREVSVALYRIRRRLRNDPELLRELGWKVDDLPFEHDA